MYGAVAPPKYYINRLFIQARCSLRVRHCPIAQQARELLSQVLGGNAASTMLSDSEAFRTVCDRRTSTHVVSLAGHKLLEPSHTYTPMRADLFDYAMCVH